ncbi:MAG: hypothetical protein HC936_13315 [Leptolyngbyaceae cyanobacterium SU_3_3]|nr:hypothetical protein [Leptolyngbyaceae cyanobacterium SU_3_3]
MGDQDRSLTALITAFISQGHSTESAKQMAIAAIFQPDLNFKNAEISRLLQQLKQEHIKADQITSS